MTSQQVFPDWSEHISTPSRAPTPPVSSHLCGSFLWRSSDLGIAFLLLVHCSVHSRKNWHDISLMFQTTHTSSPLKVNQPGKLPLPWRRQLPSQNYISHQVGGDSLMCPQNVKQWGQGAVILPSVFLTWTEPTNAHTGCQEPSGDHMNSLLLNTDITSLWSEKYTDTHKL
jgi:hypothetical protein